LAIAKPLIQTFPSVVLDLKDDFVTDLCADFPQQAL
jgi:hypothetical protein